MYASTFKNILETHYPTVANHYVGEYVFNKYPRDLGERKFALWNAANDYPGTHWRLLYKHPEELKTIELFDPLGLTKKTIDEWSLEFKPKAEIEFNTNPIQELTSNSCGYFCLYYAIHRIWNSDITMRQILSEDFSFSASQLNSNLGVIKDFFHYSDVIVETD